ncbi:MAG: L-serine ammonia-lyase, iron-sulfur-dependent, subunit beta [Clostridiales bacterium]|nr:L-serine ammonia-lyase, iron-sulfur-dependent, subunit beta [Clostridiales bacterium]
MSNPSVFDIIGPVMIGPSSSHTAGAARLAKIAKFISNGEIKSVIFYLHGSFGKTYKGHGTDRALLAGILGMEPCDIRLRDSIEIAKKEKIEFEFKEDDLGDVHPNTVKISMETKKGNKCEVVGSSIGGGRIQINQINGNNVDFTGEYNTLIVFLVDVKGAVSKVSSILFNNNINIAFMKVFRNDKGKDATMVFEVDNHIPDVVLKEIGNLDIINRVIKINTIGEGE